MGCTRQGNSDCVPELQKSILEQAEEKKSKMNYEKAQAIAQLFRAIEDATRKIEEAYMQKDLEKFNQAKKAILEFQKQVKMELEND